jgi:hypothetical protein
MTRQDGLQTRRPRADGPTTANRPPTVAQIAAGIGGGATLKSEFPPRVEFDNYKASYLRM